MISSFKNIRFQSSGNLNSPEENERIDRIAQLVDDSTSEMLVAEDWNLIMQVVDAVQETTSPIILRGTVRSIRKRLEIESPKVICYSLILIEALVKNCGKSFHREVATEKFMNQMKKLHKVHSGRRGRDSVEIASRVLELIQAWGEAFLPFKNDLPLFSEMYHKMRRQGVDFPKQYDDTKAPVLTPPPTSLSDEDNVSEFSRLSTDELDRLVENLVEMLEDMIDAAKSKIDLESDLLKEIVAQCRRLEPELLKRIEHAVVSNDGALEHRLALNDTLQSILMKYDNILKGKLVIQNKKKEDIIKPSMKTKPKTKNETTKGNDLIDLLSPNSSENDTKLEDKASIRQQMTLKEFPDHSNLKSKSTSSLFIPSLKPPKSYSSSKSINQSVAENSNRTAPFIPFDSITLKSPMENNPGLTSMEKLEREKILESKSDDPFDAFVQARSATIQDSGLEVDFFSSTCDNAHDMNKSKSLNNVSLFEQHGSVEKSKSESTLQFNYPQTTNPLSNISPLIPSFDFGNSIESSRIPTSVEIQSYQNPFDSPTKPAGTNHLNSRKNPLDDFFNS